MGFWGILWHSVWIKQPRTLSKAVHILSPVKIESKKFAFLGMESIYWQVLLILRFSVGLKDIRLQRLHTFLMLCYVLVIVHWQHSNSIAYSQLVKNWRLQWPSKIEDREFDGVQCAGGQKNILWILRCIASPIRHDILWI